jgi:L-ascorbate metabolism protein UlaG (beta-lactamase superfamily)
VKHTLALIACIALVAWSAGSTEKPRHERDTAEVPQGTIAGALANRRTTDHIPTSKGDLVVSPLDHASILFAWDGKAIYVDPTSPAIEDQRYPKADLVLLTEAHFDHLDAVAVARLRKQGTVVVGPPAVAERTSVDLVLNEGDTRDVLGIRVRAVPLYDLERGPAPGVLYHPRGRGVGYVLDLGGTHVYLSGDTDCTPEVRALEHVDVAFIAVSPPLGMSPADAVQCIEAMRPGIAFPYHDRYVDLTGLEQALAGSGVDVRDRNFYPRAERWRRDAVTACNEGQIGICRDRLEAARELDPQSEKDPRVIHCREMVRAWQNPFPPWW